jgi:hypothetical protein
VDNFSGFTRLFLCPDGSNSGQNSVTALGQLREAFPAGRVKLYSDKGAIETTAQGRRTFTGSAAPAARGKPVQTG